MDGQIEINDATVECAGVKNIYFNDPNRVFRDDIYYRFLHSYKFDLPKIVEVIPNSM